jgi:hypothetical protein
MARPNVAGKSLHVQNSRRSRDDVSHYYGVFRFFAVILSWFAPGADLPGCVIYWQSALGLENWTIELRIVRQDELEGGTLGDIEPNGQTRTAVLRVRSEADSDLSSRLTRADQRLTIAHEMVHLRRFASGDPRWGNEHATTLQTGELLHRHGRRWELSAVEGQ